MNNNCCTEEIVTTNCSHSYHRGNGLLVAVVLYILLAILLGSFRACY